MDMDILHSQLKKPQQLPEHLLIIFLTQILAQMQCLGTIIIH